MRKAARLAAIGVLSLAAVMCSAEERSDTGGTIAGADRQCKERVYFEHRAGWDAI